MIFAVGTLVAAAVCIGTLNDFFGTDSISGFDLLTETRATTGWIIFVAGAAIGIMALFILLRIAGRGSTGTAALGILISVLLGLGYLAGGVAAAVFTKDWNDIRSLSISLSGFSIDEVDRIFASLAAAAALCFFSDVLLVVLVIVIIIGSRNQEL